MLRTCSADICSISARLKSGRAREYIASSEYWAATLYTSSSARYSSVIARSARLANFSDVWSTYLSHPLPIASPIASYSSPARALSLTTFNSWSLRNSRRHSLRRESPKLASVGPSPFCALPPAKAPKRPIPRAPGAPMIAPPAAAPRVPPVTTPPTPTSQCPAAIANIGFARKLRSCVCGNKIVLPYLTTILAFM